MTSAIDHVLGRGEIVCGPPARSEELDAVAEYFDAPFPEPLRELWRIRGSVQLPSLAARILNPAEIPGRIDPGLEERGFAPILDTHQSDYLAVVVRKPLAPRVAFIPHDDGPAHIRLLYRSVDGLLEALSNLLDRGGVSAGGEDADGFFHQTAGDYPPDAPRTLEDQQAARSLLATDGSLGEWNWAIQLLDASNLAEWARLLETRDEVRRDAVLRLRQMSDPAVRDLFRQDQLAFDRFVEAVARAARDAGLPVGERQAECLQVGSLWMNVQAFFYRRNSPNALPRIVAWFEDLIAGRRPADRAGHILCDQ